MTKIKFADEQQQKDKHANRVCKTLWDWVRKTFGPEEKKEDESKTKPRSRAPSQHLIEYERGVKKKMQVRVSRGSRKGIVPLVPIQLPDQLLSQYLLRLRLTRADVSEPTLKTLNVLLDAHVSHIAYENLDIHCRKKGPGPPLDPLTSTKRIVQNKRGGMCFQLVDGFRALLSSLNFKVSLHNASCGDRFSEETWGNHAVLVVHIDDLMYIADAGLGDGPAQAMELKDHEWEDRGYSYTMQELKKGFWRFGHDNTGSFPGFTVDLTTSVRGMHEFTCYHQFYYMDIDSPFEKSGVVLQRHKPNVGIICLRGCTLRRVHPDLPQGKEILAQFITKSDWFKMLASMFFITCEDMTESEKERLWRRTLKDHKAWQSRKRQRMDTIVQEPY